MLHLIVFRLVQIQAMAESDGESRSQVGKERDGDGSVEVVVCIKNLKAVAGDFPIHDVLRALTTLPITNICRDAEGHESSMLLERSVNFFRTEAIRNPSTLYLLVLSKNSFFNEQSNQTCAGTDVEGACFESVEANIIGRYRALVDEKSSRLKVIAGTERFCRQGYQRCDETELSMSPYLYASGLLGSAEALMSLLVGLSDLQQAAAASGGQDLTRLLRSYARWPGAQVEVIADEEQRIFGTLTEAMPGKGGHFGVRGWLVG